MEPNYSEYTIEELEEVLGKIDRDAYPDRVEVIKTELNERYSKSNATLTPYNSDFDFNEQFYKCPNCGEKIGFFSKTLNTWGKKRTCPHCLQPFAFKPNIKILGLLFIPAMLVHFVLLKPLLMALGLSGSLSIGIVSGITTLLSMRLRRIP